jgi:hypothetical protein
VYWKLKLLSRVVSVSSKSGFSPSLALLTPSGTEKTRASVQSDITLRWWCEKNDFCPLKLEICIFCKNLLKRRKTWSWVVTKQRWNKILVILGDLNYHLEDWRLGVGLVLHLVFINTKYEEI